MATNFWSKRASFLLSGINFKDGVSIDSLSADPTVTATDAKTSSIGIFNGVAYIKADDGLTTNWESLGLASDLLAHINQATDAHDASAISVDNTNTTILKESLITDTQTALETLDAELLEALSTGLYKFTNGGLTVNVDPTKFDIGEVDGHIVDSVGATKVYKDIAVPAVTGITPIITDGTIFVYYNAASTLVQSITTPTAQDRRDKVYLGRVTVLSGNVIGTAPEPTIVSDPTNQTRDFAEALRTFNVSGNLITPSAANNLQIRKTSGSIFSMGRNFASDIYNPNVISFSAADPVGFIYGGQTLASIVYTTVTSLDPTQYDNGGTIEAITGSNNRATLQRVYLFTDGRLAIQYGQVVYNSLALALQASSNEDFVENPIVFANKGVLLATIAIAKGCTSTQDDTTCRVLLASRFGQGSVGAAGVSVSSLQNAYDNKIDAIPDIVIDPTRVDPELSIVNDSDDAVRDLFGVYNNAKDTEFLAVDPTETRVKQLGFTDNVTAKVGTTTGENVTITDSLGTELLRKESDLLFIEDFKENAPTTFLTASNAAITVNDATNSTYLSNTIATFTQSSALTTYYVESNPIPVTKKSWLLEPIKIQAMQGIAGGAGTWDLRVFTSTDGIAYTDSNIIVQVGDLKNDKIITQLASDVTHIKLRWTVVNPDDATTLTLGGILITSQAFEVGQTTVTDSSYAHNFTRDAGTGYLKYTTFEEDTNRGVILVDNSGAYTKWTALKDVESFNISTGFGGTGTSLIYIYILDSNGVVKKKIIDYILASAGEESVSFSTSMLKGESAVVWLSASISDSAVHTVSTNATAYADNVVVDAATSGLNTQSYTPATQGFGTPSALYGAKQIIGNSLIIQGKITAGTPTGDEARFYLPSGFTILDGTPIKIFAVTDRNVTTTAEQLFVIGEGGQGYLKFGKKSVSNAALTAVIGTDLVGSGNPVSFTAIVPVNELDASSQYVMLNVSNERENDYQALVDGTNSGTFTADSWNVNFIKSITKNSTGNYTVLWVDDFFTVPPAVTCEPDSVVVGNIRQCSVANVTTTGCNIGTNEFNASAVDLKFWIKASRQLADYRPQKAFIANAVSIVQANTNGVEYPTNESIDGKPVYARTWRQGADISGGATLNIATIETGLNPVNATNKVSKDEWWYIRIDSLGGANVFYRYNRVSGIVSVATQSGAESFENTLITLKYTKP